MSDAERDARRAARREERRERRRVRFGFGAGFDPGAFAEGMFRDFVAGGADMGGEEFSEPVSERFTLSGMPYLKVRNVSGKTAIRVGADGEVVVSGRKYVHASNADRARRLMDDMEVRLEQEGNEIRVGPRLYDQDHGWGDLFRGGRVAVDLEITVPREAQVDARTVSGELTISGTRGPADVKSVSGTVTVEDLQGPLRLKTVSGDASVSGFAGAVDANSVSGEVSFHASRLRDASVVTVSGDIDLDGELQGDDENLIKTISGDIDLAIAGASYTIAFRSMSGDVDTDLPADVSREGRRDKTIRMGAGATRVRVKTVSGDLHIKRATSSPPAGFAEDAFRPSEPPEEEASDQPHADAGPSARDVLDRLARGELSVDDAAAALDDLRRRAG